MSRLCKLEGLHLIDFNPKKITVDTRCTLEYNRFRKLFSGLPLLENKSNMFFKDVSGRCWAVLQYIIKIQEPCIDKRQSVVAWNIHDLINNDRKSCYANVIVQCLFHCPILR